MFGYESTLCPFLVLLRSTMCTFNLVFLFTLLKISFKRFSCDGSIMLLQRSFRCRHLFKPSNLQVLKSWGLSYTPHSVQAFKSPSVKKLRTFLYPSLVPLYHKTSHCSLSTLLQNITLLFVNVTTVLQNITLLFVNVTTVLQNITLLFVNVTTVLQNITLLFVNVTTVLQNITLLFVNVAFSLGSPNWTKSHLYLKYRVPPC